jgi:serine/threonine-protein kinase RsbT
MQPEADLLSCTVGVSSQLDVEQVRRMTRMLAAHAGFDRHQAEAIVLAISELATNLLRYAPGGELRVAIVSTESGMGLAIQCQDAGPGIADVALALQDGFSTSGGLGSGLPAVRRLMDEFEISTSPSGTHIEAHKWVSSPSPSP